MKKSIEVNSLVLICNHFPFGKGETFFDAEFTFLQEHFDSIVLVSKNTKDEQRVPVNEKVQLYRYRVQSTFSEKLALMFHLLTKPLFFRLFRKEISYFNRYFSGKYNRKRSYVKIFHDLVKAFQFSRYLDKLPIKPNSIYYSYWLNSSAIGLCLRKETRGKGCYIARGHGSDVFFDAFNAYLPYRSCLSKSLDGLFLISEAGKTFMAKLPETNMERIHVSRIGAIKLFENEYRQFESLYTLVSCSNLVELKRVDKIINVISQLKRVKVKWVHFGDGVEMEKLKHLAEEKLKHVEYSFNGHVKNNDIQAFYAQHQVDLFLNLSASEGIPVSIMEAAAYGIPTLAGRVGGIPELVNNSNGILVEVDESDEAIAAKLEDFLLLPENDRKNKGRLAYETWKKNYDAATNSNLFYSKLIELCKSPMN